MIKVRLSHNSVQENLALMGESNHNPTRTTLIASLKERKVPQIFGFYIGAGWGMVQFIEWIVERYGLSPYLPDISLVILFSLIPSVLLIAYFHGRPGTDSWTKIEKITIPVNLILTLFLINSFFSVNDLGAATRTMTVTNENGEMVERTVAKKQFRKKIILFNIKNNSGDKNLDWMENALPMAVRYDLLQSPFIDTYSMLLGGSSLYNQLKRLGYPQGVDIPIPLMQKLAIKEHYQSFLNGSFDKKGNKFILTLRIYDTKTGSQVELKTLSDNNIFTLIDKFSVAIRKGLDVPDYRLENIQDFPVAEILTKNTEAFKLMVKGIQLMAYKNDYTQAAELTEKAVRIDSRFSLAYLYLGIYYVNENNTKKALDALSLSLKYDFKLPEFLKFSLKGFYYIIKGDSKKRLALLKMQAQLEPENMDVKQQLANIFVTSEQYDEAISVYQDMMEQSEEPDIYFDDIGQVYIQKNQLNEAEEYLKKYAMSFPKEAHSFNLLAYLYGLQDKEELLRKNYEKSLFLEQDNLFAQLGLAALELKNGKISSAYEMYKSALEEAEEPADKYQIEKNLAYLYIIKGQPHKALELIKSSVEEFKKFMPPLSVLFVQLININYYVLAHKENEGFNLLKNIKDKLQQPFDNLISLGYASIYLKLKNPEKAEPYIEIFDKTIKKLDSTLQGYKYLALKLRGKLEELKQHNKLALDYFQKYARNTPTERTRFTDIGRLYRKLSEYEMAIKTFEKQLNISPYDPYVNYQMGLAYARMGQKINAKKYFQRAAKIWKDAEKDFEYAVDNKKQLLLLNQR